MFIEQEAELKTKKLRVEEGTGSGSDPKRIETGILSKIPPELFIHILKFLSSEVPLHCFLDVWLLVWLYWDMIKLWQDLVSCSLVCKFLNSAASDESLWRRLWVSSFEKDCAFLSIVWFCANVSLKVCSFWTLKQRFPYFLLNLFRYCMRWGLVPPSENLRVCAWKKLYIQVHF